MDQRVAVIGLGQMGGGMALRLRECGYDVSGHDTNAAVRQAHAAQGIRAAETIADAVADRDVILSSLPDSQAARAAWLGGDGIVACARPGALCIDLSTIDPASMRALGDAASARGLAVLDCPVSGSPKDARAGTLVLMVGGEAEACARAEPLLDRLGSGRHLTGGVGTAKVVKIVNNMMSMGNVLVAAEAFAVGVTSGVAPETLFNVLSKSGGRSFHFERRFPNALKGDFKPGFKIELAEKDLALAVDLGRQVKVPTPAASGARELYALALAEGFRGQDIVALLSLYQRWAKGAEPKPQ